MTTNQQQDQGDRFVLDHPGLKNAIADSIEKLEEIRRSFEQALEEMLTFDKKIAEFNAASSSAKLAADDVTSMIRANYKGDGTGIRDAIKLKAKRRAYLEDAEDFKWLVQDAKRTRIHSELRAIRSSHAYFNVTLSALREAEQYFESVLIKSLPVELLMFIQIKAEIAASGLSTHYKEDTTVNNPMEFALRELHRTLMVEFTSRNHALEMARFLPPYPDSIGGYRHSPLKIKKIEDDLAAMEAAQ